LAAGIVLGLSMSAQAKTEAPPCSSTTFNVTSIFANADSNNDPFQWQSDGKGAYVTYTKSKTDSVTSEITYCEWSFDLNTSTERTISLTLLYPASTPLANPPFTTATEVTANFVDVCGDQVGNTDGLDYGLMTTTGQTLECGLRLGAIPYKGKTYAVAFNPVNWPGSTNLQVTCTGVGAGYCNSWTITPIPGLVDPYTGQTSAIGALLEVTEPGAGNPGSTLMGLYYFAFDVTIHE
jgi:hypothetical protein